MTPPFALIQIDVGQGLNLVAIVASTADRSEADSLRLRRRATRKSMAKF